MTNCMQDKASNIEDLGKASQYLSQQLYGAPTGALRISKEPNGNVRYYFKRREGEAIKDTPLNKDDPLVVRLACKSYHSKMKKAVDEELKALKYREKHYHPEEKYDIYSRLSPERKALIQPIFIPPNQRAQLWESSPWTRYKGYPERLVFETDSGEMVRSKSERTIANLLYQHRDVLVYRYEQEIFLEKANMTVHPDFTIMNRETGKLFYWEHVGMLDNEEYANDFVRKMNAYIQEGMYPADNFILTFETGTIPENVQIEKMMLKLLMEG